jgi:hypothetical protein
MTSSSPSATTTSVTPARAFTWIDALVLPVALSVMDAQPLVLALALGSLFFAHTLAAQPVNPAELVAMIVALHLWSGAVERHGGEEQRRTKTVQHLAGLLVAIAIIAGPYLITSGQGFNLLTGLVLAALMLFEWRRATARGNFSLLPEDLLATFRFNLIVVLLVVIIGASASGLGALDAVQAQTLPLFFLSALVALALTRLNALRQAHPATGQRALGLGRAWSMMLFGAGGLLVALELAIAFGILDPILGFLLPAWEALREWAQLIISLVAAPFFWVYGHVFTDAGSASIGDRRPDAKDLGPASALYDYIKPVNPPSLFYDVLLVIALCALGIYVARLLTVSLAGRKVAPSGGDETREQLDRDALARQRLANRAARQRQPRLRLEKLDPESARARYRELLQGTSGDRLTEHRPDETPAEYAARLHAIIQKFDAPQEIAGALDELTNAYRTERYAGHAADATQRERQRRAVPNLLARLKRRR